MSKQCRHCGQWKSHVEFRPGKRDCKECISWKEFKRVRAGGQVKVTPEVNGNTR